VFKVREGEKNFALKIVQQLVGRLYDEQKAITRQEHRFDGKNRIPLRVVNTF
jgi:hypothetical protein